MNLSAPFIRRPTATTLLTVAIALAGAVAYTMLPVSPLPQVDFPTIAVSAGLPGASAEIMASSIATPLERQFSRIAGVEEMTSASSLGITSVTLQFDLDRNIDGAARDVEAAINAARSYLPADLPANPTYRKVNPADAPILIIGVTSEQFDTGKLYDIASTIVQQKLSQIRGVGLVNVAGGAPPGVRVDVNPTRLASFGLTLSSIRTLLSLQNSDRPRGQIANEFVTADIVTNGQISQAENYRPLVVVYHNGAAVTLGDVADVTDSVQNIRAAGYVDGKPGIAIVVSRQPGANIITTVDRIRSELPRIQATMPQGIDMGVVLDRTTTIRASVSDVERTLVLSVVLVVFVVLLFVRRWRATLIPSVAVPVSLIGTFGVMYLFGSSVDNLSLMALTISAGFVVDDAIVVMENISRHLEEGMAPQDAALRGASEIGFTVVSISASLVAVFIPILLMSGIVGRLFREFAVTLVTAIVVSMIVSLTATPMMCAYLLKPDHRKTEHGWLLRFYKRTLTRVLAHPALTLLALIATIALNVGLTYRLPKGFFPLQDTGVVFGALQGPQDASFAVMNASLREAVTLTTADPAVAHAIGFTGTGNTNSATVFMALKPVADRDHTAEGVVNRLQSTFRARPLASAFLQPAQDLRIGGRQSSALFQYTIHADSVADLSIWGPKLFEGMRALPGFQDVNTDQQNGGLRESLTYDRASAARLGLTAQAINGELYSAFGQSQASVIYRPLNQYYVVLEVATPFRQRPESLRDIYFNSPSGGVVPLQAAATSRPGTTALAVNHSGLFPSVTVSFNLAPGMSLGEATAAIDRLHDRLQAPSTIHGSFAGTLEAFQRSLASEPALILTALVAVYIVLGVLYESMKHPLTILSTLPSASIGAMLALMVFKLDLDVISLIGIILLVGIVKKNAIMMIDFAILAEREQHKSPRDAIFEACVLRFRPILMTTMAAVFGALPLAFGTGMGSELRRPLGITIVGGLLVSQLLTLYTTPVVYLYLDRIRLSWKRVAAPVGAILLAAVALSGCAVGPTYHAPQMTAPAAYKETATAAAADAENWRPASPQDAMLRGAWWETFADAELNALESGVATTNQNIAQAYEQYMAAQAAVRQLRAQYLPTVGANSGAARTRSSTQNGSAYTLTGDASWEPDLWGRVRYTVAQARAGAQVSAADLENVRLAQHSAAAQLYFQVRGLDALQQVLDDTVASDRKTVAYARAQYDTGVGTRLSLVEAENALETAEAAAINVGLGRAQNEHALAVLLGKTPAEFSLPRRPLDAVPPAVPLGIPSGLLERRPDIAAAERTMAQANARIGLALTAYYPNVTLTGSAGVQAQSFLSWLAWPNRLWSVGAAVAQTVFDGGARRATVQQYEAIYNADVASYRQTVLNAFQEVEDSLAASRILADQTEKQAHAVTSAQEFFALELDRYRLGIDPYVNVLTAQATLLNAQQALANLHTSRMTAIVQLIAALGGGWDRSELAPGHE